MIKNAIHPWNIVLTINLLFFQTIIFSKVVISNNENDSKGKPLVSITIEPISQSPLSRPANPIIVLDRALTSLNAETIEKFSVYTIREWHHFVDSCDPTGRSISVHRWSQENRNEILCHFNFYQFPVFREYVATLEGYHEAIVAVHARLIQDKIFAKKLDAVPMNRKESVKSFICREVEQSKKIIAHKHEQQLHIQQAAIVKQQQEIILQQVQANAIVQAQQRDLSAIADSAQSIGKPQTEPEARLLYRADAIKITEHENFRMSGQQYTILPVTQTLLQAVDLDANNLTQCYGTAIQQCVHDELVTNLNRAALLHERNSNNLEIRRIAESAVEFAHVGIAYNNAGYVTQAFEISNLTSALLDYGKAIALGAVDGVGNVMHSVLHPIDIVLNIGHTTEAVIYHLGKVLYEVCDISGTYLTDPIAAHDKIYAHADNIKAICQEINEKYQSLTGLEIARGIATFATEAVVTAQCLDAVGQFYSNAQTKALEFVKKVEQGLATTPELLASAEGLEVRIASEAAETAMLSAKQGFNESCRVAMLKASEDVAHYVDEFKKIGLNGITKNNLKHIFKNHMPGGQGAIIGENSVFYENINVIKLALEAWTKGTQTTSSTKIFDTGKIIGFDQDGFITTKVLVRLDGTQSTIRTMYPIS